MERTESFGSSRAARRSHAPLSDAQFADYMALMSKARELEVSRRFDEGVLVRRLAARVAQSGA